MDILEVLVVAEHLFILGAGASKESGAPIMSDFFDKAEDLLILKKTGEYREDFENVFQLINDLSGVYSKSFLDLNNIESVFGAIEMGSIISSLAGRSTEEINGIRKSLIRLIVKTLDQTIQFKIDTDGIIK